MNKTKIITVDAIVIGSGASGYNAAYRIKKDGKKFPVIACAVLVRPRKNKGELLCSPKSK